MQMQVLRSHAPGLRVNLRDRRSQPQARVLSLQSIHRQLQACDVYLHDERMPVHGRPLHVQRQALRSQARSLQGHRARAQLHNHRSQPQGPVLSVQHARVHARSDGLQPWIYYRSWHKNKWHLASIPMQLQPGIVAWR
ncbi:MAG: hypothetical protein R2810_16215 [Flavobacteriales bacterium]